MNDMQRWAFIEDLFKEMIELCNEIMRQCEEPTPTGERWSDYCTEVGRRRVRSAPICDEEVAQMLEDAKDYLSRGA